MKPRNRRERPQQNDSSNSMGGWSGGPVPEANGQWPLALLALLAGAAILGVFYSLT